MKENEGEEKSKGEEKRRRTDATLARHD